MIPQLTTDKRCLRAVSPGTTEIDGVRLLACDPTMREYKTEFLSCGSAGGGDICFSLADSGDGMDLTVIEECSIRSEDIVHIAADITILEIIPIDLCTIALLKLESPAASVSSYYKSSDLR